jgi:hypothetical protein
MYQDVGLKELRWQTRGSRKEMVLNLGIRGSENYLFLLSLFSDQLVQLSPLSYPPDLSIRTPRYGKYPAIGIYQPRRKKHIIGSKIGALPRTWLRRNKQGYFRARLGMAIIRHWNWSNAKGRITAGHRKTAAGYVRDRLPEPSTCFGVFECEVGKKR